MEKSSLLLITDGNPNLCRSDTCEQATKKKKKNQSTTAIVASVVSSIVFLSAIAILWSLKRRKHKGNSFSIYSFILVFGLHSRNYFLNYLKSYLYNLIFAHERLLKGNVGGKTLKLKN
ncbi:uncharacterized protein LOC114266829 [Camellia sinensis]|uniref:uncharacterized protein LOC114266829 n=1 Tax=Camellia sinensis TaxID=4442 RepID=UPI00103552A4|nr:uncharacterized protein LOC114266829 [Camellia sinensis]